ncbi:hypothetical protein H4582DRAFT_1992166 [Lactarius indigo]|nr:hypothetical protein H4582DRAFT_1992166 [Lactarius indigo]
MRSSFLELSPTGLSLFGKQRVHWDLFLSLPINNEKLHYHNHLQTISTMLFYKPLVSLVTAMALASTITASATPVRRSDPRCQAQNGSLYCCAEVGPLSTLEPSVGYIGGLLGLYPDIVVGVDCVPFNVDCTDGITACCEDSPMQYGPISFSLMCTIL